MLDLRSPELHRGQKAMDEEEWLAGAVHFVIELVSSVIAIWHKRLLSHGSLEPSPKSPRRATLKRDTLCARDVLRFDLDSFAYAEKHPPRPRASRD